MYFLKLVVKYVRVLLVISIVMAIIAAVFARLRMCALDEVIKISIKAGLISAAIFSSLVVLDILATLKYGKDPEKLKLHQNRNLVINMTYDEGFVLIEKIVSGMGINRKRVDKGRGIIRATTGVTWKSFGEKIEVKIDSIDSNTLSIKVKSRPRICANMIDYGKNYENVKTFCMAVTNPGCKESEEK